MKKRRGIKIVTPEKPIKIERLTPTGEGIGTIDSIKNSGNIKADGNNSDNTDHSESGMKIFLWNALPDELVTEYQETKRHSHYISGIATRIEHVSKDRIEPKDSHYLSTSPWQIMTVEAEEKAKTELVYEIYHDLKPEVEAAGGVKFVRSVLNYFYRNKMEYSLWYDHDTERIELATHLRGTHTKIPITTSSIEKPEIYARACEIVNDLNRNGDEARRYQSLLLRANQDGEVSGGLYENHQPHPVFKNLKDDILGHTYSYSPNGFFQINLPVYENALRKIQELLADCGETDKVIDLYSGVGTIGLSVARDKDLTLVEVDKSAYQELEKNSSEIAAELKKAGKTPRIQPVLARSEDALEYISSDAVVILDPPRAGCEDKLIQKLLEVKPKGIIYLSCNPSTQARDVKKLLEDYRMTSITAFNFFPRTPHIECLVSLKLK